MSLCLEAYNHNLVSILVEITVGCGNYGSCTEDHFDTQFAKLSSGGTLKFNCGNDKKTFQFTTHKWIKHSVTIDGGNNIVLDAQNSNRHFIVLKEDKSNADGLQVEIKNIKLQNGRGTQVEPLPSSSDGGCIFVGAKGQLTLRAVSISGCESAGSGGAVYGFHESQITAMGNSLFTDNTAAVNGGAILIWQVGALSVENAEFNENEATAGGAIYAEPYSQATVSGSVFYKNKATNGEGGAVRINSPNTDETTPQVTIQNCNFIENSASKYGGAFYAFERDVTIDGSKFLENSASEGGGALSKFSKGNFVVSNSDFAKNTATAQADARAGAIYITGSPITIQNSRFEENEGNQKGGAVYACVDGNIIIEDSFFCSNKIAGGTQFLHSAGLHRDCDQTWCGVCGSMTITDTVMTGNIVSTDNSESNLGDSPGTAQLINSYIPGATGSLNSNTLQQCAVTICPQNSNDAFCNHQKTTDPFDAQTEGTTANNNNNDNGNANDNNNDNTGDNNDDNNNDDNNNDNDNTNNNNDNTNNDNTNNDNDNNDDSDNSNNDDNNNENNDNTEVQEYEQTGEGVLHTSPGILKLTIVVVCKFLKQFLVTLTFKKSTGVAPEVNLGEHPHNLYASTKKIIFEKISSFKIDLDFNFIIHSFYPETELTFPFTASATMKACVTIQSAKSGSNRGDRVTIACPQDHSSLVGCFIKSFDGRRQGEQTHINGDGVVECAAYNGHGGEGVFAVARCCALAWDETCNYHSGGISGSWDQASSSVRAFIIIM